MSSVNFEITPTTLVKAKLFQFKRKSFRNFLLAAFLFSLAWSGQGNEYGFISRFLLSFSAIIILWFIIVILVGVPAQIRKLKKMGRLFGKIQFKEGEFIVAYPNLEIENIMGTKDFEIIESNTFMILFLKFQKFNSIYVQIPKSRFTGEQLSEIRNLV